MRSNRKYSIIACLSLLFTTSCAFQDRYAVSSQVQKAAMTVPPGTAQRIWWASGPSAYLASDAKDLVNMLDIEAASYVVKAPDSAQGDCYLQFAEQYFVDGKPETRDIPYPPDPDAKRQLTSARSWLVDILVWPDWFSSETRGFAYAIRVRPLDGGEQWSSGGRYFYNYPKEVRSKVLPLFTLYRPWNQLVRIDEDVPLACYHNLSLSRPMSEDTSLMERVRNSEVACIFYVRVRQKDRAPVEENGAGKHNTRLETMPRWAAAQP